MSPLFTDNTVLGVYQGNPDGTVYSAAGGGFNPNAPTFDVASTTLNVTNTGEMTFASGNEIVFFSGNVNTLGDASIPDARGVTFTPVDSTATSVPFEFSPTLGLLAVGSIWGVSRLRKRAAASKNHRGYFCLVFNRF